MANPVVTIHSKLSFSGRERWAACPVSVVLSDGEPDNSSPAAAEGTAAHAVGEFYVRQMFELPGAQPGEAPAQEPPPGMDRFGGLTNGGFAAEVATWNDELRKHGKAYAAFIRSLGEKYAGGGQFFVALEQRVAATSIHEQLFGTADCLIWCPGTGVLIVVDYKFGFKDVHVGTRSEPNKQLSAYGVAAMDRSTLAAKGFVLAVFQPRRPLGEPAQVLELPAEWLDEERARIAAEAARTDAARAGDADASTPVPGDHCRYCKGKAKCGVVGNVATAAIQAHSGARSVLDIPEDELIAIFAARTVLKAFMEDVEERIEQLLKTGHPRLTVKETQGKRMWKNPSAAAFTLLAIGRTDLLAPVALSQAIDALPEELHDELITRSRPSRSVVVLDRDKLPDVAQVFAKFAKTA
jgi:hypothetical protein